MQTVVMQFHGGRPCSYWYRSRDGIKCVNQPHQVDDEWAHYGGYWKVGPDGAVVCMTAAAGLGEPYKTLPGHGTVENTVREAWAALGVMGL